MQLVWTLWFKRNLKYFRKYPSSNFCLRLLNNINQCLFLLKKKKKKKELKKSVHPCMLIFADLITWVWREFIKTKGQQIFIPSTTFSWSSKIVFQSHTLTTGAIRVAVRASRAHGPCSSAPFPNTAMKDTTVIPLQHRKWTSLHKPSHQKLAASLC